MRDRVFCFSLVLPLTLIALMLSCGKAKMTWTGTIVEEAGITIVKNPQEPIYTPVLRLPLKDTPVVCKGSALHTLEEDEDGFQSVKRYRMTWGI